MAHGRTYDHTKKINQEGESAGVCVVISLYKTEKIYRLFNIFVVATKLNKNWLPMAIITRQTYYIGLCRNILIHSYRWRNSLTKPCKYRHYAEKQIASNSPKALFSAIIMIRKGGLLWR